MKTTLSHIAILSTGIYAQSDLLADTLYLQGNHFSETGTFDNSAKPHIKLTNKHEKHLLENGDILFVAKGFKNYAVVYHDSIGQAVASSSFIIIRIMQQHKQKISSRYLAWYINNSKQIEVFHKQKASSTIPSISISQLSELEINIPDLQVQELVVNIRQLREKEKETIKKLEFLKDQLTQQTLLKAITK